MGDRVRSLQGLSQTALITLNEDEDLFITPELPRPIKYAEATNAIAELIRVSPTAMPVQQTIAGGGGGV